tara:strand:+ start:857 stop:1888 length:1032 start_codon:yes stop_codon:yes gene_type:complete
MAKSSRAFSPKEFTCWVKAETAAGTSVLGTSMFQLDVDSVSFPTLNATQVLDIRNGGRVLKDADFFQDNTLRVVELSISGTMHEDAGHQLLMQNICNDYTANPSVSVTYTPPLIAYENGDGAAKTNDTAGDTMTVVIAGADETDSGTGNVQPSNTRNLVFSGMVCTNFVLSADAGTEGGRVKFSATLQSGKKPTLNDATACGGTYYVGTDTKSFNTSSEHLCAGLEVVMSNFTVTLDNPASFYGMCSSGYEGLTRGAEFAVTFDTQVKYDTQTRDLVNTFDTQSVPISADLFEFTNNNAFGVNIDNGVLTNVAYSEGDLMMLDVSGKATSDGTGNLVIFDCNE